MTSFRGQASQAKMTSPRGKLIALVCHPTKKSEQNWVNNPSLYEHWVNLVQVKHLQPSRGAQYLMGESLKVAWDRFSTIIQAELVSKHYTCSWKLGRGSVLPAKVSNPWWSQNKGQTRSPPLEQYIILVLPAKTRLGSIYLPKNRVSKCANYI